MSAAEILTTESAPLQTQATTQTTEAANGSAWYDSIQDAELKGWAANKKYESPEMAAKAAWSLERLLGADKAGRTVVLPKDDTDVEGMKAFRAKLGVPETPDGYKLPLPEGQTDDAFAKTAATWFHKNGIPPKAAEGIVNEWNTFMQEAIKSETEAEKAKSEQEVLSLQAEFGAKWDEKKEFAQRGFRQVAKDAGIDNAKIADLEAKIGTADLVKIFSRIGEMTGEAGFAGGNNPGQFSQTKDQAQEEWNAIQAKRVSGEINDYTWNKEYMGPDGKLDKLMKQLTR